MLRSAVAKGALGLVLLAVWAGTLFPAQAEGRSPMRGQWWKAPGVMEQLGLTKEEVQKLDQLHVELQGRMIDHRAKIQKARMQLDLLLDQEKLDQAALERQFDTLAQAKAERSRDTSRFILSVRQLLGRERYGKLRKWFLAHRPPEPPARQ